MAFDNVFTKKNFTKCGNGQLSDNTTLLFQR